MPAFLYLVALADGTGPVLGMLLCLAALPRPAWGLQLLSVGLLRGRGAAGALVFPGGLVLHFALGHALGARLDLLQLRGVVFRL